MSDVARTALLLLPLLFLSLSLSLEWARIPPFLSLALPFPPSFSEDSRAQHPPPPCFAGLQDGISSWCLQSSPLFGAMRSRTKLREGEQLGTSMPH